MFLVSFWMEKKVSYLVLWVLSVVLNMLREGIVMIQVVVNVIHLTS